MRRLGAWVRDAMTRVRNFARWALARRRGCMYEVESSGHRVRIEAPTSRELHALVHLFSDSDNGPDWRLYEDLR